MQTAIGEKVKMYRSAAGRIDTETATQVLDMLGVMEKRGLGTTWTLPDALEARGLSQPDLVRCLMEMGARHYVEALIGKSIVVGPPSPLLLQPKPYPEIIRRGDDRRVLSMRSPAFFKIMSQIHPGKKGRVLTITPVYERLSRVRRGMSIEQLLARGVRRRDLLMARRRGWLVLEVGT